ncbi:Eukaryotic aspartyl protease family protein [Euphorbia peplus]|nr:Eukaryotic aspartyl protease family protein [Euphorbia peplus]
MRMLVMFNTLILMYFLLQTFTNATKPKKLVTKLIHRDSIISPFYNPIHSVKDRADRILYNSLARFNHLQKKRKTSFRDEGTYETYQAKLQVEGHGFLVNLSIGQPPVSQLVILDTGSKVLWVQCKPCKNCFEQNFPIYDPSTSSSYRNLPCDHPDCTHMPNNTHCDSFGYCVYHESYVDKSMSRGNIGIENITFSTPDKGLAVLNDVLLGCGHENYLQFGTSGSGILGLGHSPTSIVVNIGLKFSYCIGSVHDPNYLFNFLILGDSAITEGYSTPLEVDDGFYYLSLEGISLGQENLNIDSNLFNKSFPTGSGTLIDSGSELIFIHEVAYGVIKNKVQGILNGFLSTYVTKYNTKSLCYQGRISRDLKGFPTATFHFSEGADLVLDIESLFYHTNEDIFCLALIPVPPDQPTVIGILAQQYYNVGFDLMQDRIYFQRIDCQVLIS